MLETWEVFLILFVTFLGYFLQEYFCGGGVTPACCLFLALLRSAGAGWMTGEIDS